LRPAEGFAALGFFLGIVELREQVLSEYIGIQAA
jgi:hypothetical protein